MILLTQSYGRPCIDFIGDIADPKYALLALFPPALMIVQELVYYNIYL